MDYSSQLRQILTVLNEIYSFVVSISGTLDSLIEIIVPQLDYIAAILLFFFFTWLGFTLIRPRIFKI